MSVVAVTSGNDEGLAWQHWFRPGRFLILLSLVIVAGYPDVVFGPNTFVTRDFAYFGYPLAHYHKLRFWEGEIPLWNPLNNCGLPFLAQWNTMVLYPGSLFYLLLPLSWALGVFCLLHLLLGGMGMYFLALKWTRHRLGACVAGVAFATNGLMLNSLMWPNNVSALGWMPWVILLADMGWSAGGRRLLLAVAVGAMQMLTGAPEIILLTWAFLLGLGVCKVSIDPSQVVAIARRFLFSILLIAGLAAAQLLPFLELLAHSQRNEKFFESVWPMPGTGWANLLVPLFHCYKTAQGIYFQSEQYWTASYYVGAWTLTLAAVATLLCREKRVRLLAAFTLLGLVLAMGDNGYLYPMLKKALPAIGFMRFPIKLVVWVAFALPLLAAFGVRTVLTTGSTRSPHHVRWTVGMTLVATLLIGLLVGFARLYPGGEEVWTETAMSGLSRSLFLWGGLALVTMLRLPKPSGSRILFGCGLVLLAGFDPMTYANQKTPTAPRTAYLQTLLSLEPHPAVGESRVVTTYWAHQNFNRLSTSSPLNDFLVKRSGLFANCNLLEGIPKLDGFYSLYLREPDAIWSLFYFQTNNRTTAELFSSKNPLDYSGLLDFIGSSHLSSPKKYFEWTPRSTHLPWVTGGQAPLYATGIETLRALVRPGFDPRRVVYLPPDASGEITVSNGVPPAVSSRWRAQSIEIDVRTEQPALLVLSQSHYPAWVADEDGKPTRIWKANFAFQAVAVSPGRHIVRLRYQDWPFYWGVLVSASAFVWLGWKMRGTTGF